MTLIKALGRLSAQRFFAFGPVNKSSAIVNLGASNTVNWFVVIPTNFVE